MRLLSGDTDTVLSTMDIIHISHIFQEDPNDKKLKLCEKSNFEHQSFTRMESTHKLNARISPHVYLFKNINNMHALIA